MRYLLAVILLFNTIGVVNGNAFMLAPGLSVKNALLYGSVVLLFMSAILGKRLRMELPGVMVAFGLLIAYAVVSAVAVANSEVYPRYTLMGSLARIKGDQLDWAIFFAMFSIGVATRAEAEQLLKVLLGFVGIANVITIWNAVGLPLIGKSVFNPEVYYGLPRIDGFFGHANETASMIVTFLPIFFALIGGSRGASRAMWISFCVASCMVVVGTVSRGALVGIVLAAVWMSLRWNRYVSVGRFVKWGVLAVMLALLVLPFVGTGYLEKFLGRFTGVSTVSATDISSGRTELWTNGVMAMLKYPWSLISGMGWNTWAVQGFQFLPHSHYLWIYFDLGILGLGCFIYLFVGIYGMARRAVDSAQSSAERRLPLAFVYAIPTYCICMVFANITVPWIFIWPLMGLIARNSFLIVQDSLRQGGGQAVTPAPTASQADRFSLPKRVPVPGSGRAAGRPGVRG